MQKTQNYNLNQWEPTDEIRREDFNADNAAIDAALAANAKALSDYQTANDAAVAKKAETSTVTALQQSVNSQIAALSTALGSGGKTARITYGTYTGTGTYGSGNPNKLNFDFCPVVVMCHAGSYTPPPAIFLRGATTVANTDSKEPVSFTLSWASNAVTWYETSSAANQLNTSGTTYHYVAVGYSD